MMDLEDYDMKDMMLAAIKSEVESRDVYLQLAGKIENGYLSDKLRFIAEEELKHRDYLESIYKMEFQEDVPVLPENSPVPLPDVKVDKPFIQASDVMGQAMVAEKAASDFYESLSGKFEDQDIKKTLIYLARMEIGHYKLLEIEREYLESEEDYEIEWEMMHVGP
jgi:rubrerythrin